MTTSKEWILAFSAQLGVAAPSDEDVAMILALAGEAAHSSERTAAPVACWLGARADLHPAAALECARRLEFTGEP